jgi:hypothetical protein
MKPKNYFDQGDKEEKSPNFPLANPDEKNIMAVTKNSEDWRFVEFHLKSSFTSEIDITKVYSLYNQHMIINFEKRSRGKLYSYAWYSLKDKSDDKAVINYLNKLRTKGFDIQDGGMEFNVGLIFDEKYDDANNNETESAYILCKIIVGKSLCVLEGSEHMSHVKYEEYDSIVTSSTESNINKTKPLNYKLFNTANVLPMF